MSEAMERIRAEALGLSISERAELAVLLIESLDNEEPSDDLAEVERAWLQKVRRRIDDTDPGRVETIPAGYGRSVVQAKRPAARTCSRPLLL